MVGYGKNLSHRQNNSHQRLSPYCRKQLTSHLCGSVVLTTQAVTAHREIHLAQEEASRATNNSFRPSFPLPPPRPFFPGPVVVQRPVAMRLENNNISLTLSAGSTQINIISHPPNLMPPQVFAPARINNQAQQSVAMATRGDDVNRPFLRLLEHPIPKVVGFMDQEEENGGNKLDLTLKL
ncbi:hypothetical protein TIFTF001_033148 [Ficus carica]|uniref:Uncharacterized protein n=1 Tax=Ficus carica TaxID=3494 RepID=A0AA88DYE8_FICCA|nr:hypothetical protein TIFTF001_033148 [Ficus carica]